MTNERTTLNRAPQGRYRRKGIVRAAMAACGLATAPPVATAATPMTAESGQPAEPSRIYEDVIYRSVDGIDLHLNVYVQPQATEAAAPVVVYFHGGGWARGQRPESWSGFRTFLSAGFSVVTVQYRLSGQAPAPAAVQDARCAVHWIGARAKEHNFDPARIVAYGTSAGGHLALMAGYLSDSDDIDAEECRGGPNVVAVLDFYGPTELTRIRPAKAGRHPSVVRWIGNHPGAEAMDAAMSPARYVDGDTPATFIVHGDRDEVVPISQSILLMEALQGAGVDVELVTVPGGGHGKFDAPAKKEIFDRALSFVRSRGIIK